MMMITDRLRHILTTVAVALMAAGFLTSCSDDDEGPATRYAVLYDMVEYAGQRDGSTQFKLYVPDSEKSADLTTGQDLNMKSVKTGECVLLAYVPQSGEAYTSGPVDVRGIGAVTNGKLMKGPSESLTGWDHDPIWLHSIWRAGGYIMMRIQLVYDRNPRLFRLVIDDSTIGNEYPDAYLVNARKGDADNYRKLYYVAWDVSALWTYDYIKGLRVHVNNANNTSLRTFTFEKPTNFTPGTGDIPEDKE